MCGRFPFGLPALKWRITTTHSTSADCRPRCLVSHPSSVYIAPGSINGVLMLYWCWKTGEEKVKHTYSYLCGVTQKCVLYLVGYHNFTSNCGGARQRAVFKIVVWWWQKGSAPIVKSSKFAHDMLDAWSHVVKRILEFMLKTSSFSLEFDAVCRKLLMVYDCNICSSFGTHHKNNQGIRKRAHTIEVD